LDGTVVADQGHADLNVYSAFAGTGLMKNRASRSQSSWQWIRPGQKAHRLNHYSPVIFTQGLPNF
jgi:hypothetical protein